MKKIKDHYFQKAKREGYAARSIYKLEEIDKKNRLICNGDFVIDFGCSPGSWLQYASKKVGKNGYVLGVDINKVNIKLPDNVNVIRVDIFETNLEDFNIKGKMANVILSDISPKTTGIRSVDAQRSIDLNIRVLELTEQLLNPVGSILLKAFQGSSLEKLNKDLKKMFNEVRLIKPRSSRSESVEIYLLCRKKK